jgi:aminopeptidase N
MLQAAMRLYTSVLFLSAFALSADAFAQCAHTLRNPKAALRTTTLSPLEDAYDVTHLKLDLTMTNLGTTLSGHATTTARVTDPAGLNRYAFELSPDITLDSLRVNGILYTPSRQSDGLRIATLQTTLPQNATLTAQAWYHGTPPAGTGFFGRGLIHSTTPAGTPVTFSLSDTYVAMDWWPCKQSLVDKVDSADLWFTVPAGCKAGSNGLLTATVPGPPGKTQYRWKTAYPIVYYLISVAIAPYTDRSSYMHFSDGTGDSMLIQHYLPDPAVLSQTTYRRLDSTAQLVDGFSKLFGRYPFWKEKYGHCIAPLGGGMEHQTMSTIGSSFGAISIDLIAHELGHQWWGDHVTFHSRADIWLSEGFASYCELLADEFVHGKTGNAFTRTFVFENVMSLPGGTVHVDDTMDQMRVFDRRLTYDKGSAVAHMLRFIAPSDSAYFTALRQYQQQFSHSTASTADLKSIAESVYGFSLDTFFNQWIYGEGFPRYSGAYNQTGDTVIIRLMQQTSVPSSVPLFHTPLELKVFYAGGDTVVRVYNNAPRQIFTFTWNKAITRVLFDPNEHILNSVTGDFRRDNGLDIHDTDQYDQISVYPNPAPDGWTISGMTEGTRFRLYNSTGMLVYEGVCDEPTEFIDVRALPGGIYLLRADRGRISPFSRLLLHQ